MTIDWWIESGSILKLKENHKMTTSPYVINPLKNWEIYCSKMKKHQRDWEQDFFLKGQNMYSCGKYSLMIFFLPD